MNKKLISPPPPRPPEPFSDFRYIRKPKLKKRKQPKSVTKSNGELSNKMKRHLKRSLLKNINARATGEVRDHFKVLVDSRNRWHVSFWFLASLNVICLEALVLVYALAHFKI